MPKVTYIINGEPVTVEGKEGETLLQIALDHDIVMEHACGGNGFCTTCLCKVKEGADHLSPRNDREENMGVTEDAERLGCQAQVQGDTTVEVVEY